MATSYISYNLFVHLVIFPHGKRDVICGHYSNPYIKLYAIRVDRWLDNKNRELKRFVFSRESVLSMFWLYMAGIRRGGVADCPLEGHDRVYRVFDVAGTVGGCFGQRDKSDGKEKKNGQADQNAQGYDRFPFQIMVFPEKA